MIRERGGEANLADGRFVHPQPKPTIHLGSSSHRRRRADSADKNERSFILSHVNSIQIQSQAKISSPSSCICMYARSHSVAEKLSNHVKRDAEAVATIK